MILYHPDGTAFAIDGTAWVQALQAARETGWRPCGTLPPPVDLLDVPGVVPAEWAGGYESACGQEVTAPDATALGLALAEWAGMRPASRNESGGTALARFCASGGFLVCREPDGSSGLLALAGHLDEARCGAPEPAGYRLRISSTGSSR